MAYRALRCVLMVILLLIVTLLASCSPPPATTPNAVADIPEQMSTLPPTHTPVPTATSTRTLTPTASATATITQTPEFVIRNDFSDEPDGVLSFEISEGVGTRSYAFQHSAAYPIAYASFSADMAVSRIGATSDFDAHLDLHGMGTVRSWYAQIGYHYAYGQLSYSCNAYSYSSDTPRYWQDAGPAPYNQMNTFMIEVVPTDEGWGYAFRFLINGVERCRFDPPDRWDGDNRREIHMQAVEIYLNGSNEGPGTIFYTIDNYTAFSQP